MSRFILNSRKENIKRRPFPYFTVNRDSPLVVFYDPVDNGQSHSCPFTRFFRGEERIKNPLHNVPTHAAACIAYGQLDVGSLFQGRVFRSQLGIDFAPG